MGLEEDTDEEMEYEEDEDGEEFLCPICMGKHPINNSVCCYSNRYVPKSFSEHIENLYIPVTGACMAGKSVYVGTLVQALSSDLPLSALSFADEDSDKYYRNFYFNSLYKGYVCARDYPDSAGDPLLFEIKLVKNDGSDFKCGLALYDVQGQIYANDGEFHFDFYKQLLINSSGIIYLIDPLQIPKIRKRLSKEYELSFIADDVLTKITNIISENKTTVPVAFVLTKIDALLTHNLMKSDSALWRNIDNNQTSVNEFKAIDKEIGHFLKKYLEKDV